MLVFGILGRLEIFIFELIELHICFIVYFGIILRQMAVGQEILLKILLYYGVGKSGAYQYFFVFDIHIYIGLFVKG